MEGSTVRRLGSLAAALAMVATTLAVVTGPVRSVEAATTFTVDTADDLPDANPADGVCADVLGRCSLRAAVMQANATVGADTIILPPGTYAFTIGGASENAAATGDLDITDDLTITGTDAATTIIDANSIDRVLHFWGRFVAVISGVTITGGVAPAGGGGLVVSNSSVVTIADSVVRDNSTTAYGGGITNAGSLTVARTTISGNSGTAGAGIYSPWEESTLTLDQVSIGPGNRAESFGGGLHVVLGTVTIQNGTEISGNNAAEDGGGIRVEGGRVTVRDSVISGNVADSDSDSAGDGGGVHVGGGTVTIEESVIGGANRGYYGGGIHVEAGMVSIVDSSIVDNAAVGAGGGLAVLGGTVDMARSTLADNAAPGAAGILNTGTTTVSNSTISGNTAMTGSSGGIATQAGTLSLLASTVAYNSAATFGAGIVELGGTIDLEASIVAENTAGTSPDCFGSPTSDGYNLIGDDSGCGYAAAATDLVRTAAAPVDPLLGPLQDNGSPDTHALLEGSPAIDHIPTAACAVSEDERQVSRPQGAGCDIGAFELAPLVPDTVGLVGPGTGQWHLRNGAGAVTSFFFGNPGDVPFVGDWDGDGTATPGLFRQSDAFAYLRNSNSQGVAGVRFFFGNPSDIPLSGDWDGDGDDTLSIYRPSEQRFYIINTLGENEGGLGAADYSFLFGNPGDKPVVGDWDGDGIDEVGLHRESIGFFYWRNTLDTGVADGEIFFGDPGDRFVSGDWGVVDGKDTPGLFRPSDVTFYFRHTLTQGVADSQFTWTGAGAGWLPVSGRFGLG